MHCLTWQLRIRIARFRFLGLARISHAPSLPTLAGIVLHWPDQNVNNSHLGLTAWSTRSSSQCDADIICIEAIAFRAVAGYMHHGVGIAAAVQNGDKKGRSGSPTGVGVGMRFHPGERVNQGLYRWQGGRSKSGLSVQQEKCRYVRRIFSYIHEVGMAVLNRKTARHAAPL